MQYSSITPKKENMSNYIMGVDPYKKVRWYHKVKKFFGFKVKVGTSSIMQYTDESKTTVKLINTKDIYL